MENSNLFDLSIDANASGYLSETARWGRFLAIVGFIGCGFMILMGLFMSFLPFTPGGFVTGTGEYASTAAAAGARVAVMIVYIVFGIISIVPYLYLYRFSTQAKQAVQSSAQEVLTSAFANLKSLFKFYGVLTIIMLGFLALGILIAVIGAVVAIGAAG
jgi:hypothetical protein